MIEVFKNFLREEDGMGTIEVVVIIAILVMIALVFRDGISEFVGKLMDKFFTVPDI